MVAKPPITGTRVFVAPPENITSKGLAAQTSLETCHSKEMILVKRLIIAMNVSIAIQRQRWVSIAVLRPTLITSSQPDRRLVEQELRIPPIVW